jgi:V8-like Glu-specific endopeptidase
MRSSLTLLLVAFSAQLLSACSTAPRSNSAPTPLDDVVVKPIDWNSFQSSVIVKTYRGKNSFICTAVMLNETTALTSAHCLKRGTHSEVIIGPSLSDLYSKTIRVNQKSVRYHPGYRKEKSLYQDDLAVFKLVAPAPVTVFPEIAPGDLVLNRGDHLDRVGFGLRNNQNGRGWTDVIFRERVNGTIFLLDGLSVIGDSGSPIYLKKDGHLYLVGLHSTLIETGRTAVVDVPFYRGWIQKP